MKRLMECARRRAFPRMLPILKTVAVATAHSSLVKARPTMMMQGLSCCVEGFDCYAAG